MKYLLIVLIITNIFAEDCEKFKSNLENSNKIIFLKEEMGTRYKIEDLSKTELNELINSCNGIKSCKENNNDLSLRCGALIIKQIEENNSSVLKSNKRISLD